VGTDKPAPAALQPLLNAFPLPNGPENGTTGMAQFVAAFSIPGRVDATSVRIDHSVNRKFTIFGRYSDSPSETMSRGTLSLASPTTTSTTVRSLTLGATNLITEHLVNEFRFNYARNNGGFQQTLDSFGGAMPFTLADIRDAAGQPIVGIDLFGMLLAFGGNAQLQIREIASRQRQVNTVDTLSYTLERHLLKFGVDYRQLTTPLTIANRAESATFTSKTQLQQNLASSGAAQSQASVPIGPVYKNLSLFAQDDWKPTQRLNLSLGVRWELNPPPTDAYGNPPYTLDQITNLATAQVAPKGTPLWNTTYGNFAPRVGAAYRLRRSSGKETVIRGGFGVFYDLGDTYASQGYGGVGIAVTKTLPSVPFPLTAGQLALAPPSVTPPYSAIVIAFDPNLKLPYTLQWNAAIEQAIRQNQTLTVGYVGSAARRLLWQHNLRPAPSGNPNFTATGFLSLATNRGTSDYDALQIQYQRRLSRGLQAMASYTWAHSIDEVSINLASTQLLRANSNFDIRHNFQAAVTYDLPGKYDNRFADALLRHWSLYTRIAARSALPFDISSGTFIDSTGVNEQLRADLVPGQPIYIADPTAPGGRLVNFNAFTQPTTAEKAALQFGNTPRNLLRGFPVWQVDFAMRREFPIHERLKLQFRAEAFNIFNHPIFGAIQTNLTTGAAVFGRATGTLNTQLGGLNALYQQGGPRSFQVALKFVF